MPFTEHDHLVEALPADGADEPFHVGILPGCARGGEDLTTPQSPWQNPFVERLIGSVRRECLDHLVVLGESHLHRILTAYFAYDHRVRTHLSLEKDAPDGRAIERPEVGRVVQIPEVGGLHHRYVRRAA